MKRGHLNNNKKKKKNTFLAFDLSTAPQAKSNSQTLNPQLSSVSWRNCGPSSDSLRVSSLDVVPAVLHLPQSFNVSFAAELKRDEGGPIKVSLKSCPTWRFAVRVYTPRISQKEQQWRGLELFHLF